MSTSIESKLSLALAVKLTRIFETDDKFLTFPLGVGFSAKFLNFMKDPASSGLTLQEHLNFKGEFSLLLNIIPQDSPRFSNDASNLLWDELKSVLINSQFAQSALNEKEQKRLAEAEDFLTDDEKQESGVIVPIYSPALKAYYHYKRIFESTEEAYLDEKITIESATGTESESLRQEWDAHREKQLLTAKARAEQDWLTLGFKKKVENFQATKNELETRRYLNHYRQDYLNELAISEIADFNNAGTGIYPSFFSPSDVFDPQTQWPKINLTKEEIITLANDAAPPLKSLFNDGQGDEDIFAVTCEYNNVVIIRPWFKPEFFQSRYWKLPEHTSLVSDGKIPCQGKIPAFITSMIVIRNLVLTKKKSANEVARVIPLLSSAPLESLMLKNPLFNRPILQQRSFVSAEYQERMQKSLTMRMMPSKSSFTRFGQNRLEAELARPSPPHRVIAPPPLPSSAATLNIERLAQIRNSYGIIKYQ